MDMDRVELLRSLFAAIADLVEHAHAAAMEGQDAHKRSEAYVRAAERTLAHAQEVCVLAQAAATLARGACS